MKIHTLSRLALLAACCALTSPAQPPRDTLFQALKFREIGPAIMGGRVDDLAVVESDPRIIYVATASGGIFKTINGGVSWEPVFDDQSSSTIGDIALAPSDPSILYVGTGEPNNRQSSSWGNGVYRSLDAGKTWQHVGLKDTQSIGRVAVHPTDPMTVYVAALGHLWGPNKERGVYKSTDGGATWKQVLFINEDTGISDVAIDPQSPNTLYAAAYQRRRTVFGYNGGGPHSGLYKSVDGGAHWSKLTKGLPSEGDIGRCAVEVYRKNPNIVYALVENLKGGGIFRSEDKGASWTRMSDTNPRPSYYSQIRVDPNNDQKIWVLGAPLYLTEDGGKTFRQDRWPKIHSDFHAMWINPANSDHVMLAGDGGFAVTHDSGRNWDFVNNLAIGQFYEIGVDMKKPYNICGGLQDNNSWCGPSSTLYTRGISNDEWFTVGGGDGFYAQVDPTDANIVYAESQDGNVLRRDLRTGQSRSIRPLEDNDKAPRYRFQWNSPIVISRYDAKTIYYGGNHLFKSKNRGDSWERLGNDLTSGIERDKLEIFGKVPDKETLSRHDGVQQFPCITTISESPRKQGLIWVGTDDGNVQLTRDDGKTWTNVVSRIPGVKKGAYVSRVVASAHNDGTAYVAFDNHRSDDFAIYIYRTTNFGESWSRVTEGIPAEAGTVHVVREHPRAQNLLFAGTEFGLYVSFNAGQKWERLKNNLPTVPVDDIAIHPRENDLILGTHGRSIWILDDIAPLEQMSDAVQSADVQLFDPRPATEWSLFSHKQFTGSREFIAPNAPLGAILNFYLSSKPAAPVRITVKNKNGEQVREITIDKAEAGVNRAVWDLRHDPAVQPARRPGASGETEQDSEPGGGGPFGRGGGRGPWVEPGEYSVTVSVAGKTSTKTVTVEDDPRVVLSAEDRARRRDAVMKLYAMSKDADASRRRITALRTSLTTLTDGWKAPNAPKVPEEVKKAATDLLAKVKDAVPNFEQDREGQLGAAGPPLKYTPPPVNQKIQRLMFGIDGYGAAPTARQLADIEQASAQLATASAEVQRLTGDELTTLNKMMADAGVPYVSAEAAPSAPGGRRRGGE